MRRISTLAFLLALLTAACAGSSEETTTTATPETSTTEVEIEQTTTTAPPETTTTAQPGSTTSLPETTTSVEPVTGIDDCLVGTWVVDNDTFAENFGPIFAEAGMPDAEVTVLDGTFTVELDADGSMTAERDGWGFDIVTAEGTVTIEIDGTETGTWAADGSTMTVETGESDIAVNSSVEVDGQVIEIPEGQAPVEAPTGIASNSEYTCSGDTVTLVNEGVESVLTRA